MSSSAAGLPFGRPDATEGEETWNGWLALSVFLRELVERWL